MIASDDDVFEDEDCNHLASKVTFDKRYTDGYRTHKIIKEEKYLQEGFDNGFEVGMRLGQLLGQLLCCLRSKMNAVEGAEHMLPSLDQLFCEKLPTIIANPNTPPHELAYNIRTAVLLYINSNPNYPSKDELLSIINMYFPPKPIKE